MMVVVGQLSHTGFFEMVTFQVVKASKGKKKRLFIILCVTSGETQHNAQTLPQDANTNVDTNLNASTRGKYSSEVLQCSHACAFFVVVVCSVKRSDGVLFIVIVVACLCAGCFAAVLSAFLDNVTTILLVGPVTLKMCSVLKINPLPFLLGEVSKQHKLAPASKILNQTQMLMCLLYYRCNTSLYMSLLLLLLSFSVSE